MESFNDDDTSFRQRLWGAAVIIAIMVIVLPLILDGAGSESQFPRVEKLRHEPPSILETDGTVTLQTIPSPETFGTDETDNEGQGSSESTYTTADIREPRSTDEEIKDSLRRDRDINPLTAWVVLAGSFQNEQNATDIRDLLRKAGFASFVSEVESASSAYQVLVGPMISEDSAMQAKQDVESVLGLSVKLKTYP